MSRIALLELADQIGLPVPTQTEMAEYVQTKAAFLNSEQAFDAEAYTEFLDSLETNPNMSQALLAQALREDFRIDQVAARLSGPGLQLEAEAIHQAKINKMELALSVAEIDYNDFLPDLSASDEDLKAFFTDNEKRYEVPEKIQAATIKFAAKNYPAKYTDEALAAHFEANRAQFTSPAPATDPSEDTATNAEVTFESVRDQVILDYTRKLQMQAAHEAAQAFAYLCKSIEPLGCLHVPYSKIRLELGNRPFHQAEAPTYGIPAERAQSVLNSMIADFFRMPMPQTMALRY